MQTVVNLELIAELREKSQYLNDFADYLNDEQLILFIDRNNNFLFSEADYKAAETQDIFPVRVFRAIQASEIKTDPDADKLLAIARTSPALKEKAADYPACWYGKVPLMVKMAKMVTADAPLSLLPGKSNPIACRGEKFYVHCDSHGALSVIFPSGEKLPVNVYDFEVIEWHEE